MTARDREIVQALSLKVRLFSQRQIAACAPLNVTHGSNLPPNVTEQAIDLTDVFRQPQLLYFHLPATISPSAAPEIGRLAAYMLLAAATQTERKHPVFLVVDEFQRMVAGNLEYMLQLARSMGVGVILANQSMEDLKTASINLIPAVEANCRLRQWFSVSSALDQERLIRGSGETIDRKYSYSISTGPTGQISHTEGFSEEVVTRFGMNDVLLTSDHPFRSILRISRGEGYAQYGGMPVILESEHYITKAEYDRRRTLPWPVLPGSFLPSASPSPLQDDPTTQLLTSNTSSLEWTNEIIDPNQTRSPLSPSEDAALGQLFEEFQKSFPPQVPAPKRRKRS